MDESALFWRMMPTTSVVLPAEGAPRGGKKDKSRVSLVFCVNAGGSNKLKPVIIGTAARPLCFRGASAGYSRQVSYMSQANGWMTKNLFSTWVHEHFVPQVNASNENPVVLLVDGFSGHKIPVPEYVKLVFLPPQDHQHFSTLGPWHYFMLQDALPFRSCQEFHPQVRAPSDPSEYRKKKVHVVRCRRPCGVQLVAGHSNDYQQLRD
jgi:hypothetical protein